MAKPAAATKKSTSVSGFLSLEEMARRRPIRATEKMPPEIAEMITPTPSVYIRSDRKPSTDFRIEPVNGLPDLWQVLGNDSKQELLTAIPGSTQKQVSPGEDSGVVPESLPSYRPPWLDQEFLPKLVPFRLSGLETGLAEERTFLEPRATEAQRLTYPWCTVGKVITRSTTGNFGGSGVLVGPNLMLTAGHVSALSAPPGWSMEFIPAASTGDPTNPAPYGSAFVEEIYGYDLPSMRPFGYDYAICKLNKRLGTALGWMGATYFEPDDYYDKVFTSSGYPATFGGKPAVEFGVTVQDIDSDDPGLEIETRRYTSSGWSGGPLWFYHDASGGAPMVVGICSGFELDFASTSPLDVYAGYHAMMRIIQHGYDHWQS